jgi:hypothetical protein
MLPCKGSLNQAGGPTNLSTAMNSLLFLAAYAIALAGVTYTSLVVIRILKIRGIAKTAICLVIFNCAQMVLAIETLSLVHAIGAWQLLILHCACAAILYVCGFRPPESFWRNLTRDILRWISSTPDRLLQVLIVAVICGGMTTFVLAVSIPPNNFDAMTYHMARVGYYLQHGGLDSFSTANIRQTVFPANAEILILWQAVLLHNDHAAALVQWFSWCGTILAVYALARLLAFSCRNSLFAALAFACFPEVVLQSTSAQNDLVTAFFMICAFVFVSSMPGENKPVGAALVAGIALGLALGTKTVAFLMAPGLAIYALVFFSRTEKHSWHKILSLGGFGIAGFILFGAYIYIQNLYLYGSWIGPEPIRELHALQALDWHATWSNLGRILIQFINPAGGLPYTSHIYAIGNRIYTSIAEHAFAYLHISKSIPGVDFFAATWAPSTAIHEDYTAYGPLFGYIALPIVFGTFLFSWCRERRAQRKALAFAAILFIALVAATLRWQHWHMRLMLGLVAIASPLLAVVYSVKRTKTCFVWNLLLVGSCLTSLWVCVVFNQMKPLRGPNAIWGRDRTSLMCAGSPSAERLIRIVDGMQLKGLHLGIVPANPETFEYPLFGEHFNRELTTMRIDRSRASILQDLRTMDCVLVYSEAQEYFLTKENGKNQWFGKTDLHPLLAAMRASGSNWVPIFDADGFGHFFVKKSLGNPYNMTRSLPDFMPEDSEWYDDRWVGQNFKIRVRLDPEKPTLMIRGETPALGMRPVLVISAPGIPELERIEQDKPGPFNYALSLSRVIEQRAGTYATLTFASNLVFNPKKLGQSDDSRDLSWRLMDIKLSAEISPLRASPVDYRILDGWWSDQWVADELRLAVRTSPGKSLVVIQGIVPPEIPCQELQIYVGKQAFSKREFVPGAFTWGVPLGDLLSSRAGDDIDMTISSSKSFNPKKLGQSEDSRNLCWRLSNLRLSSP